MNIQKLTSMGGLLPSEMVKQEITWDRIDETGEAQSDVFTVHVRRMSFADHEEIAGIVHVAYAGDADEHQERSAWQSVMRNSRAAIICVAIRLGDQAEEQLTYEQAQHLDPTLAEALFSAVEAVNPRPKKKARTNRPAVARAGSKRGRGNHNRASQTQHQP